MNEKEKRDAVHKEAYRVYGEATHEAFKEYEEAWKPLREKWQAFCMPHFRAMEKACRAADREYEKGKR